MFVVNVRFVCYLGFERDNMLGKQKLHFVQKLNFFTSSPLIPSFSNVQRMFFITHFQF